MKDIEIVNINDIDDYEFTIGKDYDIVNEEGVTVFRIHPYCFEDDYCMEPNVLGGYSIYIGEEYLGDLKEISEEKLYMMIPDLNDTLKEFRSKLFAIITYKLLSTPDKTIDVNITMHSTTDEDRYIETKIKSIYLDKDNYIMIKSEIEDDTFNEELDLYSIDEIINIINHI